MPLTTEQKLAYLENSNLCPVCKSEDITSKAMNTDNGSAWQDVECKSCGAE